VENAKLELLPNTNCERAHQFAGTPETSWPCRAIRGNYWRAKFRVCGEGQLGKTVLERRPIQVGIGMRQIMRWSAELTGEDTVALPGDADFRDGMPVKVVNLDTTNVPAGTVRVINFICALLVCLTLAAAARAEETPLEKAKGAFEKGEYTQAVEILKSAAGSEPNNGDFLSCWRDPTLELNQYDAA